MKDTIKKIILEEQEKHVKLVERNLKLAETNKIISLIGPRRIGKTYALFQVIKKLKESTNPQNIVYINFDDERLRLNQNNVGLVLEAYLELYPEKQKEKIYFFLDEIQEVKGWEKFVRRMYDRQNIKIYVTGSSSKLLSKEIATSLRGRTLAFEMWPLSFEEYLRFKKIELSKNYEYSGKRYELIKQFEEYLKYGGYPEIVFEALKIKTLQSYVDLTIYKDLIERYKIRNTSLIKDLLKYIITNHSREFSVSKYLKKIQGQTKVSRETIYEYVSYLEEINLIHFVKKFSYSAAKQSNKKPYIIDTGIINAFGFSFSENKGRLLENLGFIELKRRNKEIFFHKDKHECDFIIKEKNKIIEAIQVCQELNERNKERELQGLLEAMQKYELKQGLIITKDQEDTMETEQGKIMLKPAWKWLLEKQVS